MDKNSTDQHNKKVRFGGTETVKFNSNDAPEKVRKINFSKAKYVKKNSSNIMSGLMETQFKKNDFNSGYFKYGAKLAEEHKNKGNRHVKNIELAFKEANDKWQTKMSEQKNDQERTR